MLCIYLCMYVFIYLDSGTNTKHKINYNTCVILDMHTKVVTKAYAVTLM